MKHLRLLLLIAHFAATMTLIIILFMAGGNYTAVLFTSLVAMVLFIVHLDSHYIKYWKPKTGYGARRIRTKEKNH